MEENLFPQTIAEAKIIQERLRERVIREDCFASVNYVAGVDIGFQDNYAISQAAVAVLKFPELTLADSAIATMPTVFPYVPGYLSFREIPPILEALDKLRISPDLILCDGQGLAHPRRFGLACHLGVLTALPTIGVAKSLLIGTHQALASEKGNYQALEDDGEIIGVVARSRTNVKPIYISIGHKISLPTAIAYVFNCLTQYRLPETTRWADRLSRAEFMN
jgi:deoxyribonuclease V